MDPWPDLHSWLRYEFGFLLKDPLILSSTFLSFGSVTRDAHQKHVERANIRIAVTRIKNVQ